MTAPNVPLRAALYLRISTARQAEHDVSFPAQNPQGEARCEAPVRTWRIDDLMATRDQPDATGASHSSKLKTKRVTPQMLRNLGATARRRIGLEAGGDRHNRLRAHAKRVEVAAGEVRILGSKSRLLQTLLAGSAVNSAYAQ